MIISTCIALSVAFSQDIAQCTNGEVKPPYVSVEAEISHKNTPEWYLWKASRHYGLSRDEYELLSSIMWCESRNDPNAQNKTSSAAGLFQIIEKTWNAYSPYSRNMKYDVYANIETALEIYTQSNKYHWKNCL